MTDGKRELVYGRLARRLRELGVDDFSEYLSMVERDIKGELGRFVNALTTNVTAFFRENHHFELIHKTLIPLWRKSGSRRLRVWSAGCASGQEPYSIAITLARYWGADLRDWDIKILATDLDTDVLKQANKGHYSISDIGQIDPGYRKVGFEAVPGGNFVSVKDSIRRLVVFKPLNLMSPEWPMRGTFDAVFCRNVIIYFDNDTKQRLIRRYVNLLAPAGHLFLGHAESLVGRTPELKICGRTAYQRVCATQREAA